METVKKDKMDRLKRVDMDELKESRYLKRFAIEELKEVDLCELKQHIWTS